MEELKQKIDQTLVLMDTLEEGIVSRVPEAMSEQLLHMISNIVQIFPDIVSSYGREELKEYQEEIAYWPAQMERLINASQGDDWFYFYDVLMQETKVSILEYRDRIDQF